MQISHKIPVTPWRATSTWSLRPVQLPPLLVGLSLFGFGEGLLVQSGWGATPWTVFAEGVAKNTGLTLGWTTALISSVVLLFWLPLREKPGFGTIANLTIIAAMLQVTVDFMPSAHLGVVRALYIVMALESIGAGSALYITTGLGPGPRDGLMTSIHRHFGLSIVYVRLGIEATVLVIGWLLGGRVGVGTAIFAGGIGFSIGLNLQMLSGLLKRWAND